MEHGEYVSPYGASKYRVSYSEELVPPYPCSPIHYIAILHVVATTFSLTIFLKVSSNIACKPHPQHSLPGMIPNETSHRRASSFRSSTFISRRRTSNANLPSPKECAETSTIESSSSSDKDQIRPLRRPSKHGHPQPRPTSIRISPNTSPDITHNWLTAVPVPNAAAAVSPRFSRAGVKGVVMPVKAARPLSLVELPEGCGEAVLVHRYGEGSGSSEDGVPLKELEIEPERVGPLQRALSTRSQMWRRGQQPRPSGGDDGHNQGQGQGPGRPQGIVSALGKGLSLRVASVRRLKSRTRNSNRRRTTGEDAGAGENAASYGHRQEKTGLIGHRESKSIEEETLSIQDEDNASLQLQLGANTSLRRARTGPSLKLVRKWSWEGLWKRVGRT